MMNMLTLSTIARNQTQSARPELWQGLCGLWMPGVGRQGDRLFDLSGNGGHGTQLAGFDLAADWRAGPYGPMMRLGDRKYAYSRVESSAIIESPSNHITLIFWGTYDSPNNGYAGYLEKPSTTGTVHQYSLSGQATAGDIRFFISNASYAYAGPINMNATIGANNPCFIVGRWGGHLGTTMLLEAWNFVTKSGRISATTTKTGPITTYPTTYLQFMMSRDAIMKGHMYGSWVYNRCLTDAEVQSILYDPYAQLRRREVQQYFDIGAAAAFNPAWAVNCNRLVA